MSKFDDFVLANKAFDQFTLAEREQALNEFARLHYPSVLDRFFEAVHVVITEQQAAAFPRVPTVQGGDA